MELVNVAEAARRLGLNYRTLQYWAYNGRVNTYRVGKRSLVSLDEVRASAAMTAGKDQPAPAHAGASPRGLKATA
jgi:excisionase family DNA binding protein